MSDEPHQPPTDATPPDLTKPQGEPAPEPARETIWQPLDGSAPKWDAPTPAAAASTFRKPEPRPLGAASTPAAAASAYAGAAGTDRPVFTLAAWGPRLGAWLIDGVLFGVVLLALSVGGAVALGLTVEEAIEFFGGIERNPPIGDPTPLWIIFGLQLVLQGLLPTFFLARWNGQTPGKRIVGLRVVREGGEPMTFTVAFKREFVAKTMVVGLIGGITFGVVFLFNYLWPLRDPQNRAGHDFYAKTRVVLAPRS